MLEKSRFGLSAPDKDEYIKVLHIVQRMGYEETLEPTEWRHLYILLEDVRHRRIRLSKAA